MCFNRRISNRLATSDEQQSHLELKQRKNNLMLMSVSLTHFASWLPINLFNILGSILQNFISADNFFDKFLCTNLVTHTPTQKQQI
jgi:hypothetical protein